MAVASPERSRLRLAVAIAEAEQEELSPRWTPEPYQLAPGGDWYLWLFLAGRMSGKTDACAHYVDQHVAGPACVPGYPGGHRVAIIAPTLGDAVEACVNGPSGLKAHNPGVRLVQAAGGTYARWPNGTEAKLFGAYTPEDVERLRAGGNRCLVWAEELAAWSKLEATWQQMELGLRLGQRPHVVASTTPKPRKLLIELKDAATTKVTRASSADNPHIAQHVRDALYRRYAGTRLGRQELDAEILTDVPGALWTYATFENRHAAPDLARVVVAVDPAATSGEDSDETGIVVAGKGIDGRGYVLADRTCRLSPLGWAQRAIAAYDEFSADAVVIEVNQGGEMASQTLKSVRQSLPIRTVHASRGKVVRAQPVASLYEQGRITHTAVFEELEEQLTSWTPESGQSPDRLDALVYALTHVMNPSPKVMAF